MAGAASDELFEASGACRAGAHVRPAGAHRHVFELAAFGALAIERDEPLEPLELEALAPIVARLARVALGLEAREQRAAEERDAAVLRSPLGVNPQLTITTRAAEKIAEKLG